MRVRTRFLIPALLASLLACGVAAAEEPVPPAPAFPDAGERAWQVGVVRADRLRHLTLGYTSGVMVGLMSHNPVAGAASAAALGIVKELWDARRGRFDVLDLGMTCAGAAAAAS